MQARDRGLDLIATWAVQAHHAIQHCGRGLDLVAVPTGSILIGEQHHLAGGV